MAVAKTDEFTNYINGEWSKSASGRTFDNVNPADTGDTVGRFQASTAQDAQAAVAAAAAAVDA
ncbi:aldehyde dehydrogenase family protein, partial [Cupriavidus sp. SK-3]|uniref:aldehyde dehydrogenase family protein n=1 Tax=Cupriavidus sp. SK-3 TaxID=1470558 RepID=UPI001F3617ED